MLQTEFVFWVPNKIHHLLNGILELAGIEGLEIDPLDASYNRPHDECYIKMMLVHDKVRDLHESWNTGRDDKEAPVSLLRGDKMRQLQYVFNSYNLARLQVACRHFEELRKRCCEHV